MNITLTPTITRARTLALTLTHPHALQCDYYITQGTALIFVEKAIAIVEDKQLACRTVAKDTMYDMVLW